MTHEAFDSIRQSEPRPNASVQRPRSATMYLIPNSAPRNINRFNN